MKINLQLFAKSVTDIAKEVIAGKWGNGADRKNKLTSAGYNYSDVQAAVNSILGGSSSKPATSTSNNSSTSVATSATNQQKCCWCAVNKSWYHFYTQRRR